VAKNFYRFFSILGIIYKKSCFHLKIFAASAFPAFGKTDYGRAGGKGTYRVLADQD
jgi:hypothetical protein